MTCREVLNFDIDVCFGKYIGLKLALSTDHSVVREYVTTRVIMVYESYVIITWVSVYNKLVGSFPICATRTLLDLNSTQILVLIYYNSLRDQ